MAESTVRLAMRPRASYAYEASFAVPAASMPASLLPRSYAYAVTASPVSASPVTSPRLS